LQPAASTLAFTELATFVTAAVSPRGYNLAVMFGAHSFEFACGKNAPMPARQIAKPKITDSNTNKVVYAITDSFKHPPNLAIDALPQHNAQTRRRNGVKSRDRCSLTIEKDTAQQFRVERRIPRPVQRDLIFLLNLVARMCKSLGKTAIVREK
jgi:hypothetical protein